MSHDDEHDHAEDEHQNCATCGGRGRLTDLETGERYPCDVCNGSGVEPG